MNRLVIILLITTTSLGSLSSRELLFRLPRFSPGDLPKTLIAKPHRLVPPQHWSYRQLSTLVREGHITGIPLFHFQGGKSFTRGDIARILKTLLKNIRKAERVPDPDTVTNIRWLIDEYEPELKALKVNTHFGFTEVEKIKSKNLKKKFNTTKKKRSYFSGSSTSAIAHNLNEKNSDLSQNIVINAKVRSAKFNLNASATEQDLAGTEAGVREFKTGDKFLTSVDKYSMELNHKINQRRYGMKSIFGFTGGSSFSQGLTIGNLNLEGANFAMSSASETYDLIGGRTQGTNPDEILAFHTQKKLKENLLVHIQAVGALYHPASNTGATGISGDSLLGMGVEGNYKGYAYLMEMNFKRSNGSAFYIQSSKSINDKLELVGELRHYNKLTFDYNSPNVYSGISGGDDSSDRGLGLELTYLINDEMTLVHSADTSFNGELGDFIYSYNEFDFSKDWGTVNLTYEREWVEARYNHITSFRFSYDFTEAFTSSVDWSREKIDGAGSDSTRLSLSYDALKDILSLTSTISNRHSSSGRNLSQQFGINWNRSASQFLSMQVTLGTPDSSNNSAELNFLVKF